MTRNLVPGAWPGGRELDSGTTDRWSYLGSGCPRWVGRKSLECLWWGQGGGSYLCLLLMKFSLLSSPLCPLPHSFYFNMKIALIVFLNIKFHALCKNIRQCKSVRKKKSVRINVKITHNPHHPEMDPTTFWCVAIQTCSIFARMESYHANWIPSELLTSQWTVIPSWQYL